MQQRLLERGEHFKMRACDQDLGAACESLGFDYWREVPFNKRGPLFRGSEATLKLLDKGCSLGAEQACDLHKRLTGR